MAYVVGVIYICRVRNKVAKEIDITGHKYGSLTAIKSLGNRKWLFKCDCGADYIGFKENVTSGKVKSCGCKRKCPTKDIVGQRFGRLVVLSYAGKSKWNCQCDCGNTTISLGESLKKGLTKSCGCYHSDLMSEVGKRVAKERAENGYKYLPNVGSFVRGHIPLTKTHGKTETAEYVVWCQIKARCYNSANINYSNYGGRGIKVCDRWLHSFENFINDMGERPSKDYSIDRIDVNGDYSPENCRWATSLEQANNKRNNIIISHNGQTKTLAEWCRFYDVDYGLAIQRYKAEKSFEELFAVRKARTLTDDEVRAIRNERLTVAGFYKRFGKRVSSSTVQDVYNHKTYKDVI